MRGLRAVHPLTAPEMCGLNPSRSLRGRACIQEFTMGRRQPPKRPTVRCRFDHSLRIDLAVPGEVMCALRENPGLSKVTDRDFNNLGIMILHREVEVPLFGHLRGVPLTIQLFRRCLILALDAVVRSSGTSVQDYRPRLRAYYRDRQAWCTEVMRIVKRRLRGERLSSREGQVFDAYQLISSQYGIPRNFDQFKRAARTALSKLGQETEPEDLLLAQVMYRKDSAGTAGGVFLAKNGEMCLGYRQLRDSHARVFGISRNREGGPALVESMADANDDWVDEDPASRD
ncbi:MAG: hypothetical protein ABGY29_03620, partial [bacterium]